MRRGTRRRVTRSRGRWAPGAAGGVPTRRSSGLATTTGAQSNLADGTYQFRTVVTDAAGNTASRNAITVTVDTSAPAAGTRALTNFTDSGSSGTDFVTQDKSFDLTLTGNEAGSTVAYQVSTDGGTSWSTTTGAQSNLADGTCQFRTVVTDAAGRWTRAPRRRGPGLWYRPRRRP